METYLAFFDILGFKEFIENRNEETADLYFDHLFRDSQSAIVDREFISATNGGQIPNLAKAKVNCLHVSDSIIFWSNDVTEEAFRQIITASSHFLQCSTVLRTFPVRGCVVKGQISYSPFHIKSSHNATFVNSSLYGKALIDAYLKAESQDWAGCFIDKSAIEYALQTLPLEQLQQMGLIEYDIPFKGGIRKRELAIKLYGETVNNIDQQGLEELFTQHMGGKPLVESVRIKLANTIQYLEFTRKLDSKGMV